MSSSSRPRVVVVDDHPAMLRAVIAILSGSFDVVGTATTGDAAIERARDLHPDVVVMDISMPGLDGLEATARIKKAGSDSRIVLLSNYVEDDHVLAGLSKGASGLVGKFRMARDLIAAVEHARAGRVFIPTAGVLPHWRSRSGGEHDLQLYTTDAALAGAVVSFFASALHEGNAIIAIAPEPHRQAIEAGLRTYGFDPDSLAAEGRYSAADPTEVLETVVSDGAPDCDRFNALLDPLVNRGLASATSSPPRVSMYGATAPILCGRRQFDDRLRLEQIADEFARTRPASILCGYSTEQIRDSADLSAVCGVHSVIVPAETA